VDTKGILMHIDLNGALHAGGVQPQFAPCGDPGLDRQLHHSITERVQGFRLQGIDPANERGVIRHRSPVQPTEPAANHVLVHLLLRFLITPLMQVLDDAQASEHLHRGGVPPMHQCPAMPRALVSSHLLIQRIVVKQPVQLFEHRVDALGHLRHPRTYIFGLRAIHQHLICLL
jgi:hypothetical protein